MCCEITHQHNVPQFECQCVLMWKSATESINADVPDECCYEKEQVSVLDARSRCEVLL